MSEVPIAKHGSSRLVIKLFFLALFGIIAIPIAIPVYFVGSIWMEAENAIHQADSGFKKAKKTINPEQLRAWALEASERWPDTDSSNMVPESEVPDYVQNLYATPPEFVVVNGKLVSIIWGGGFFHWILEVGPTNYVCAERPDYRTMEWTNGIYYSREARRKIQ